MSTDPANTHGEPAAPGTTVVPQPDWSKFTRQAVIAAIGGFVIYLGAGFANLGAAHDADAQHVAGTNGTKPFQLVDAGCAHAGRAVEDVVGQHPHHHRATVPA